jgi:hypothetical protein
MATGCWYHDDVWLSAHLWQRQIPIWVLNSDQHAWPVLYHRPYNKLSINSVQNMEQHQFDCLKVFNNLVPPTIPRPAAQNSSMEDGPSAAAAGQPSKGIKVQE